MKKIIEKEDFSKKLSKYLNIEPYLLEFSDFDPDKKITMEEMSSLLPFMK